jgi:hypothetical protein
VRSRTHPSTAAYFSDPLSMVEGAVFCRVAVEPSSTMKSAPTLFFSQ